VISLPPVVSIVVDANLQSNFSVNFPCTLLSYDYTWSPNDTLTIVPGDQNATMVNFLLGELALLNGVDVTVFVEWCDNTGYGNVTFKVQVIPSIQNAPSTTTSSPSTTTSSPSTTSSPTTSPSSSPQQSQPQGYSQQTSGQVSQNISGQQNTTGQVAPQTAGQTGQTNSSRRHGSHNHGNSTRSGNSTGHATYRQGNSTRRPSGQQGVNQSTSGSVKSTASWGGRRTGANRRGNQQQIQPDQTTSQGAQQTTTVTPQQVQTTSSQQATTQPSYPTYVPQQPTGQQTTASL